MRVITMTNGRADLGGPDLGTDEKSDGYVCECHRKMGNDFYFLPKGSCIMVENGQTPACEAKQDWLANGAERA